MVPYGIPTCLVLTLILGRQHSQTIICVYECCAIHFSFHKFFLPRHADMEPLSSNFYLQGEGVHSSGCSGAVVLPLLRFLAIRYLPCTLTISLTTLTVESGHFGQSYTQSPIPRCDRPLSHTVSTEGRTFKTCMPWRLYKAWEC